MSVILRRLTLAVCLILTSGLLAVAAPPDAGIIEDGKRTAADAAPAEPLSLRSLKDDVDSLKKILDDRIGLNFSGFFDVTAANYSQNPNVIDIGSLEFDITHTFRKHFEVAAALGFTRDAVTLSAAFIDIIPFGSAMSPRGTLFKGEGLHIQVGKFDITFGNEWRYYPAPDKITMTSPLTTKWVLEGDWNDIGARVLFNLSSVNGSVYMIKGLNKGNAYGGRMAVTPLMNPFTLKKGMSPRLELGLSGVYDLDRGGKIEERRYALDYSFTAGPFLMRGEYYLRDRKMTGDVTRDWATLAQAQLTALYPEFTDWITAAYGDMKPLRGVLDGWNVGAGVDFRTFSAPVTLWLRYDAYRNRKNNPFAPFRISGAQTSRITVCVNVNIEDVLIVKAEYSRYLDAAYIFTIKRSTTKYSRNAWNLQAVTKF